MPKTLQIRNVPDALHRRIKARAAMAGMSLSDYLLDQIHQAAELPTPEEMKARLLRRSSVVPSISMADAVRAERGVMKDARLASAPSHDARIELF